MLQLKFRREGDTLCVSTDQYFLYFKLELGHDEYPNTPARLCAYILAEINFRFHRYLLFCLLKLPPNLTNGDVAVGLLAERYGNEPSASEFNTSLCKSQKTLMRNIIVQHNAKMEDDKLASYA